MSNDWIKHDGGPQPVADDVWVEVLYSGSAARRIARAGNHMSLVWKGGRFKWRIVNQNTMTSLIDAARLEGIRLGLDAAAKLAEEESGNLSTTARVLQGFLSQSSATVLFTDKGIGSAIRALNPDTIARDVQTVSHQEKCDNLHIAREAVLDQLTSKAQAEGMGYDKETDQ